MIESKTSNSKIYIVCRTNMFFFLQIHKLRPFWKIIITYVVTHDVTSQPPPPTTLTEQEHIQKYQTSKLNITKIENNLLSIMQFKISDWINQPYRSFQVAVHWFSEYVDQRYWALIIGIRSIYHIDVFVKRSGRCEH